MDVPRVVSGRFRVERELGRRAGVVTWLATDEAGGRPCTVKEFRLSEAPAAETLGIFEERARILAGLRLRGIPAFVAFSCGREGSDTVCRLVQEYVPGESLAARLAGRRRFGEEWVADWLGQAAEILAPLHRRSPPLLPRNLSPGNVIVGDDGKLHLIDFDFVTPLPADPRRLGFRLPWRSTSYAPPEADAGAWTPRSPAPAPA